MADQINYYEVLGVSRNASQSEIRNAYRRLAKERHPDHAGGNEAEFSRLQEAHAVLSDPNAAVSTTRPWTSPTPPTSLRALTSARSTTSSLKSVESASLAAEATARLWASACATGYAGRSLSTRSGRAAAALGRPAARRAGTRRKTSIRNQ